MRALFLLCLSFLLTACHPEALHPTTMEGELLVLKLPIAYTVTQTGTNTGFAGAPGTGAFNETVIFTVKDERITSGVSNHMRLLTITDIKEDLWNHKERATPSPNLADWGCYDYSQPGVKRAKACFLRKELTRYESTTTKGNHQEEHVTWAIMP